MEMWRSYYDRKPVKMFFQLAEVLRTQYYAAKAAFIFKDGKQRSDYEKALPDLRKYFTAIHTIGNVEWWIVHRQRDKFSGEELGRACANAAPEVYRVSPAAALEHGRLRAEAMTIRDTKAKKGGVSEGDWKRIEELLQRCYQSLRAALRS